MARSPYAHIHADPVLKEQQLARTAARIAARQKVATTPPPDDEDHGDAMRGRLTAMSDVLRFVQAGNATMTLVSRATNARFTYKLQRPNDDQPGQNMRGTRKPIFVRLLTQSDNASDNSYAFLGTIWIEAQGFVYRHSPKSRTTRLAPSVKAIEWFAKMLNGTDLLSKCEVWHEGRCGRCGRKLTVPSSIANGFGPECINHV